MTTPLSNKPILRGALIFIAFAGAIFLSFVFRPKPPLYALTDLALTDRPEESTLTTVIISVSTEEETAESFYSTAINLDEALEKSIQKVTASPNYDAYSYFRIDVTYGGAAADPVNFIRNLPAGSSHTYFTGPNIHPKKLPTATETLTSTQISDIIYKNAVYLANQIDENGGFTFDRGIESGELLSPDYYTIAEHAASISAIMRAYSISQDVYLLRQAEKALDYLLYTLFTDKQIEGPNSGKTAYFRVLELSANALIALAVHDYQEISDNYQHNEFLQGVISFAERDLDLIEADETYVAAIPQWLARFVKDFEQIAGLDSAKSYTLPQFNAPTISELYTRFQEPWLAMFSIYPSNILYSFKGTGCEKTTITDNAFAIFTLIDSLDDSKL